MTEVEYAKRVSDSAGYVVRFRLEVSNEGGVYILLTAPGVRRHLILSETRCQQHCLAGCNIRRKSS